jgi:hypothetical protein
MQNYSTEGAFKGLVALASDYARWQLQSGHAFNAAFFFIRNSGSVGAANERRTNSADSLDLFVEAIRQLAIAQNATEGVLVFLVECVSRQKPGDAAPSPVEPAQEYLFLTHQSRTDAHSFVIPVHRNPDGTNSHFGRGQETFDQVPGFANIVPNKKPSKPERRIAKTLLRKYDQNITIADI